MQSSLRVCPWTVEVERNMEKYHVLQMIGQGCFGKVFKGRRKQTGKIVAMKFISKRGKPEKDQQNLRLEIGILQRLDHENIILLLDWFETDSDFVVVTQFAYGELFEIFQDDKRLPEAQVGNIARQLVKALNYLHSQKVIHRDMKPQNVLVSSNGTVKLCDFGFARALSSHTTVLTSIKGTPLYMAPELVQEKPYDGGVDLWSLGVICYELFVGQPPFFTDSLISLVQLIIQKPVQYPDSMSWTFRSFLKGLLQKDPKSRLGWPDLLGHPFVNEAPMPHQKPSAKTSPALRNAQKTSTVLSATAGGQKGIKSTLRVGPSGPGVWKAIEPWLPFFAEASTGTSGRHREPLNEDFADLCVKALELYSDVLELRLLCKENPKVERQGLELCLIQSEERTRGDGCSEFKAVSLPLSALLRGLVLIFSQASPSAVLSRLLVSAVGTLLSRLMKSLLSHARNWGPAWDVLSDLARLLGLWLRLLLTTGMTKLCDELLCPDGILVQFLELVPSMIAHSSKESPLCLDEGWCVQHMGASINSVKCLGVVFSHLSTATLASPSSTFVTELFQALGQSIAPLVRNNASRRVEEAVALLCLCLRSHPKVAAKAFPASACLSVQDAEKMTPAVLQALSALVHPMPFGQSKFAWSQTDGARRARHISMRGAIELIRTGMRLSLGKSDGEVAAVLWDLRRAGDRSDASALKLLISLLGTSNGMCPGHYPSTCLAFLSYSGCDFRFVFVACGFRCEQLATSLTDSIGSGFSHGSVLAALEARSC